MYGTGTHLQKRIRFQFQILLKKQTRFTILRLTTINLDKIYSFLLFCDFFDFDSCKCSFKRKKQKIFRSVVRIRGSGSVGTKRSRIYKNGPQVHIFCFASFMFTTYIYRTTAAKQTDVKVSVPLNCTRAEILTKHKELRWITRSSQDSVRSSGKPLDMNCGTLKPRL